MTRSVATMSSIDEAVDLESTKEWKKYTSYAVEVDINQDDKATEVQLGSCVRPHMRNFHVAWFGFFVAFIVWFAITPLIPEIKETLHLSKQQVWDSAIASISSTIVVRIFVGPICDKYGPRIPLAITLWIAAISTACLGFVQTGTGLILLRAAIGFTGASFVMCLFWSSINFTKEVSGSSNGFVGGWGNLGAGVTNLMMGTILFPIFKMFYNGNAERAWRSVCVVPAFIAFCTGFFILRYSDDTPKGNYSELKRHKNPNMNVESYNSLLFNSSYNINTWIYFIQYATCFGVEIALNNALGLYFIEEFNQSTESAAAITAIFGWMNLFARGLGGILSDYFNSKYGMKGRIFINTLFLFVEGVMVIVFSKCKTLGLAIFVMVIFSFFVQATKGTLFGIVPYIDYPRTGSVTGWIGAGGNVGAVCFVIVFRQYNYEVSYAIMGVSIIASCFLSFFVNIPGQSRLIGKMNESNVNIATTI